MSIFQQQQQIQLLIIMRDDLELLRNSLKNYTNVTTTDWKKAGLWLRRVRAKRLCIKCRVGFERVENLRRYEEYITELIMWVREERDRQWQRRRRRR